MSECRTPATVLASGSCAAAARRARLIHYNCTSVQCATVAALADWSILGRVPDQAVASSAPMRLRRRSCGGWRSSRARSRCRRRRPSRGGGHGELGATRRSAVGGGDREQGLSMLNHGST
jgi:hypothetical protein